MAFCLVDRSRIPTQQHKQHTAPLSLSLLFWVRFDFDTTARKDFLTLFSVEVHSLYSFLCSLVCVHLFLTCLRRHIQQKEPMFCFLLIWVDCVYFLCAVHILHIYFKLYMECLRIIFVAWVYVCVRETYTINFILIRTIYLVRRSLPKDFLRFQNPSLSSSLFSFVYFNQYVRVRVKRLICVSACVYVSVCALS